MSVRPPAEPWSASPDAVLESLETDRQNGLTGEEASRRCESFGANRLRQTEQHSLWRILWDQVRTLIMLLLVAAVGVSLAFGEYAEAVAVGVVIVLNTAIGFFTELAGSKWNRCGDCPHDRARAVPSGPGTSAGRGRPSGRRGPHAPML